MNVADSGYGGISRAADVCRLRCTKVVCRGVCVLGRRELIHLLVVRLGNVGPIDWAYGLEMSV